MEKALWGSATAAALLLMVGCSSRAVHLAPNPAGTTVGETVEGSACGVLVFDLIPAGVNTRTDRAYRNAIEGRGVALTDTEIQNSWYYIPFVGNLLCPTVRGKVQR